MYIENIMENMHIDVGMQMINMVIEFKYYRKGENFIQSSLGLGLRWIIVLQSCTRHVALSASFHPGI